MIISAILLGAGASSRMGGVDKLMEPARGMPLLRDRALMLVNSGCFAEVIVVLPPDRPARIEALERVKASLIHNPDASSGMASSIKTGIAALPATTTHALIMPADLPDLTSADMQTVTKAAREAPGKLIRATTADNKPGSPVIFPRTYFQALERLEGDESGRVVLKQNTKQIHHVPLPGNRARLDLDTPEAWAAWRAKN